MVQLNVTALTELTRAYLPAMLARGHGRILNVASTAAFQPGPLMAVYYATKAYVLSFSEAVAEEVRGTGVTVTALCPGPTESGFQAGAAMEDSSSSTAATCPAPPWSPGPDIGRCTAATPSRWWDCPTKSWHPRSASLPTGDAATRTPYAGRGALMASRPVMRVQWKLHKLVWRASGGSSAPACSGCPSSS